VSELINFRHYVKTVTFPCPVAVCLIYRIENEFLKDVEFLELCNYQLLIGGFVSTRFGSACVANGSVISRENCVDIKSFTDT
jgi:hypothetical protein